MSNREFMAVIGDFGNDHNGCCDGQRGQSNTITEISPNTNQPVKEFTQDRDGAQAHWMSMQSYMTKARCRTWQPE